MIAAFMLLVFCAMIIGVYGIFELNNMAGDIRTIQDEHWLVANAVMDIRIQIENQQVAVYAYMLGEVEAQSMCLMYKTNTLSLMTDIEGILNSDKTYQTVKNSYNTFLEFIEGSETTDGLFNITDVYYTAQVTRDSLRKDLDMLKKDIEDLFSIIELNSKDAPEYWNMTVADEAVELNIQFRECNEDILDYLIESFPITRKNHLTRFLWNYNSTSNSNNFIDGVNNLEGLIDAAVADNSTKTVSIFTYDTLRNKIFVGTSSEPAWANMVADPSTGLITIRNMELKADEDMQQAREDLVNISVQLNADLTKLEEVADAQFNQIVADSSQPAIILIIFTLVTATVATIIGLFFSRSLSRPINDLANTSKLLAKGDLKVDIKDYKRGDEVEDLARAFKDMVTFLRPAITQIRTSAESITDSSQDMASSAEEMNASTEEISSISQQIVRGMQLQTTKINQVLQQSADLKIQFSEQMQNVQLTSNFIEDIAKQVNMLALNASIEAARAGQYGRGFAVVADHIRQLADETKESVQKVDEIVDNLTDSMLTSITTISESLTTMSSIAEETSAGAEENNAATEEQAATMEEMAASAQELAQIADDLKKLVNRFTT